MHTIQASPTPLQKAPVNQSNVKKEQWHNGWAQTIKVLITESLIIWQLYNTALWIRELKTVALITPLQTTEHLTFRNQWKQPRWHFAKLPKKEKISGCPHLWELWARWLFIDKPKTIEARAHTHDGGPRDTCAYNIWAGILGLLIVTVTEMKLSFENVRIS